MAVHTMTNAENANKSNVKTVTDYPGHQIDHIWHHWDCPHAHDAAYIKERGPNCLDRCHYNEPLYMEPALESMPVHYRTY